MELHSLQVQKNQLIEKINSVEKSITIWVVLLIAGAAASAFYGAMNLAIFSISAAVVVLFSRSLFTSRDRAKLKETESNITQKQNIKINKPSPIIFTLILIGGIVWFFYIFLFISLA